MVEVIILTVLTAEICFDMLEYEESKRISHSRGLIMRLCACVLIGWSFSLTSVLLLASFYIVVFDHAMGYIIAKNIFYIGKVSKWDKIVRKIPVSIRTFLRFFIAGVLSSIHYFNDQWTLL